MEVRGWRGARTHKNEKVGETSVDEKYQEVLKGKQIKGYKLTAELSGLHKKPADEDKT